MVDDFVKELEKMSFNKLGVDIKDLKILTIIYLNEGPLPMMALTKAVGLAHKNVLARVVKLVSLRALERQITDNRDVIISIKKKGIALLHLFFLENDKISISKTEIKLNRKNAIMDKKR